MGATSNATREIFNGWDNDGLPTGDNVIGRLAAATSTNLGDVGITKITAGTIGMVSLVDSISNIAAGEHH